MESTEISTTTISTEIYDRLVDQYMKKMFSFIFEDMFRHPNKPRAELISRLKDDTMFVIVNEKTKKFTFDEDGENLYPVDDDYFVLLDVKRIMNEGFAENIRIKGKKDDIPNRWGGPAYYLVPCKGWHNLIEGLSWKDMKALGNLLDQLNPKSFTCNTVHELVNHLMKNYSNYRMIDYVGNLDLSLVDDLKELGIIV